jgi:hypothetical protein
MAHAWDGCSGERLCREAFRYYDSSSASNIQLTVLGRHAATLRLSVPDFANAGGPWLEYDGGA